MHNLIKRKKKYLLIVLAFLIIGIIFGIIYYIFLSSEVKLSITNTLIKHKIIENSILKDLIIMSSLFVFSFFIIGVPLNIFYLFYETFSIGFFVSVLTHNFGLSGFLYSLLYLIFYKLIILFLLIIYFKKLINISRLLIGIIIYKKDNFLKNKLFINVRNSLYIIIFVLIINILFYFLNPLIFEKFLYLLK